MQGLNYYSPAEVALHDVSTDCWVSFFGRVYDLTKLVAENKGLLVQPILKFAGKDITHWFDARTGNPKTHIDPETGCEMPFTPYGRFLHVAPKEPTSDWSTDVGTPWWIDEQYCKGHLTRQTRKIRITNVLSNQSDVLEVCCEESLADIRERYLKYNSNAKSYTWKSSGRVLNMEKTLEENGIEDETGEFKKLIIDPDEYIPTIHIYFNDDLG